MIEKRGLFWSELARLPIGVPLIDDFDGAHGWVDVHDHDGTKYIQWADGRFSVPLCRDQGLTTIRIESLD